MSKNYFRYSDKFASGKNLNYTVVSLFHEACLIKNYLKDNPDAKITVNGYASPEGTEEYNLQLSQRRADAVKNILVDKYGIAADRINAIGHGVGDVFSVPAWNRVGICTIDEVK